VVFDKTGTLTQGKLAVSSIQYADEASSADVANYVYSLESASNHPIARALTAWAKQQQATGTSLLSPLLNAPGEGVEAETNVGLVRIGTSEYMHRNGVQIPVLWNLQENTSVAYVSVGAKALACFQLEDSMRDEAIDSVGALRAEGIGVHIFSGDRAHAVQRVAADVGIDDWQGAMKPADKLSKVQALQQQGGVMMVGDGLNDAASLAGASVSLAMGTGAALALQNSDAVLTSDDLTMVGAAIAQARRAKRLVYQNIAWALSYNCLAMPLAFSGILQPWMAAIGMSASSLIVVLNAARLQRF